MAFVAAAPCQCFTPGGVHMTSPGLTSCFAPPSCCTQPVPAVTIRVWPSGWVCHAERAPGSKVTQEAETLESAFGWNRGSMRTEPVKYCSGALLERCEPFRVMVIASSACADSEASRQSDVAAASDFISVLSGRVPQAQCDGRGAQYGQRAREEHHADIAHGRDEPQRRTGQRER